MAKLKLWGWNYDYQRSLVFREEPRLKETYGVASKGDQSAC